MARNWYKPMVLLMWLALPAMAWNYGRVWNQLPVRMAVHFDADWQANGYTSREGALKLGMGILVLLLILFTVSTLIVHAMKPSASWPALAIAYVVVGFCWYGNQMIIDFNLKAPAVHSELVDPASPAASDSQARFMQPHW
jgi:hypothetical protein